MSNRQYKTAGVVFEPVRAKPRSGGGWILAFGVIFPGIVVAIELGTQLCAKSFFDPLPTYWHVAAVLLVLASNFLIWAHLEYGGGLSARWLAALNGAALAITTTYALLFLPVLPLAVVAIIVGIGVLPFAPLAAFAGAMISRAALSRRHPDQKLGRPLLAGLAAGLVLVIAPDIPPAATRIGMQWATSDVPSERERGVALLRRIGDDNLMLRLCYEAAGQPAGLLSAFVMLMNSGIVTRPQPQAVASTAEAREVYYRVRGVAFNTRPAPFRTGASTRFDDFALDSDLGGTQVGGRVPGLSLVSSRIDGSIAGDDLVAYLEWTVEFRNTAPLAREARLQLALPPGGVVSRATLWVNDEEREAAYGGRGEVRAAYQKVAVVQRRDPLLVTTKGADRVLAQAFPVAANGGTIRFKIGITAPLEITDATKARLTLPALLDRNFAIVSDAVHNVWIDSRQPLTVSLAGLETRRVDAKLYRVSGALGDRNLSATRQTITVERNAGTAGRVSRIGDGERVVQDVTQREATQAIMLVIDGSGRLAGTRETVIAALDAMPSTMRVGAIIASEPAQQVALAPWSATQKAAIAKLLRSTTFVGGQDNTLALAQALQTLESEPQATLLWIHGPQPVSFHGSAARLEQATARLSRLPSVVLYGFEPGPNELLPDQPWAWGARSLPQTSGPYADLSGFFAGAARQDLTKIVRRIDAQTTEGQTTEGGATDDQSKGSEHIARLWASDRVLELMRTNAATARADAVALASRYHLVTPVSGAVVLESKQQYDEARLTPVAQGTVPTVPEPHEWALMAIACMALMWLIWRRRQQQVLA